MGKEQGDGDGSQDEDEDTNDMGLDQDGLVFFTVPETSASIVSTGIMQRRGGRSSVLISRLRRGHERNCSSQEAGTSAGCGPQVQDAETIDEDSSNELVSISDLDEINNVVLYWQLGNSYLCQKCGLSFNSETSVTQHWARCRVHSVSVKVVDRACRFLDKLVDKNQITVVICAEENPFLKK